MGVRRGPWGTLRGGVGVGFTANTGGEEVNADRGANNKSKTKLEAAEEDKKRSQEHPKASKQL